MMRLFINGLAASAGGGLTYLRNVIPHLTRTPAVELTVLLPVALRKEFEPAPNLRLIDVKDPPGAFRRMVWEQMNLPELIRQSGAHILLCTGNVALWHSPVPQILLSRNSLYTSADFARDLRKRRSYFLWADTWLKGQFARRSVLRADITIAPSDAFAQELTRWSGKQVRVIHHGFDRDVFISDATPLPDTVQRQFDQASDALRLLFVSHYNYYRNFETLIRALPLLRSRMQGKKVKLFLTCRLNSRDNPGRYGAESAADLVSKLRVGDEVVELGAIPYASLHHLYRLCHLYVSPAYTETFAHPLVEAMSSGLPLVVSDLPVHREICGDAALYFSRFSPQALADCILQVHGSPQAASQLATSGLRRSQDFSWKKHVEQLLATAEELMQSKAAMR